MAANLFNRYIWLVDVINRAGRIPFEEINHRWLHSDISDGKDLPLRTFHNHRIKIECGGYKAEDIFLGVEKPTSIIKKIKELKASI